MAVGSSLPIASGWQWNMLRPLVEDARGELAREPFFIEVHSDAWIWPISPVLDSSLLRSSWTLIGDFVWRMLSRFALGMVF